jgi:hypothetical protein
MTRQIARARAGIAMAMTLLALGGCTRKTEPSASAQQDSGAQQPEFTAGDAVVVEAARATFFEAVVRRPGRTRLQVDEPDAGAPREVDAVNVYAIDPRNSGAGLAAGSFAICRVAPQTWAGCRLESRTGDKLSVTDENGQKVEVDASSVLKPTAVTELNLRQSFEQALKRKAFLDGVRDAGRPQSTKGWTARPGDHVLVASGNAYAAGRVQKIRKGQVLVVLDGEGKEPRGFARAHVFPQPPFVFTPTIGSYACVRPAPGDALWPVVRIESASEGKVTISDAQGRRRTADLRDLIPLGK